MTIYVSYYELLLEGGNRRERLGSGDAASVLARRATGPGLRLYLQEPDESPRSRMRSGAADLGPHGLCWPETTDPHVVRGAWLRLFVVGVPALQALHAAWQRQTEPKPTSWLAWDGHRLRTVEEAGALRGLCTLASGSITYLELTLPPEEALDCLDWLCATEPLS